MKVVDVAAIIHNDATFIAINKLYPLVVAQLTVARLNRNRRIYRYLIASLQMSSARHYAIHPIAFAGHKAGLRQSEAHGSKFCHCLAQRAVIYNVGKGD